MPGNNSKYTPEFREETARYILESGRSATSMAEEIGIDKNTVCSWVRAYRRKNGLPGYAEEKGIAPLSMKEKSEEDRRSKELEKENRRLRKEFHAEEPGKVLTGDITYIRTDLGWAYLAAVMDLYNREIVDMQ